MVSSSTFMFLFFKLKSGPFEVYMGIKREVRNVFNHQAFIMHCNIW